MFRKNIKLEMYIKCIKKVHNITTLDLRMHPNIGWQSSTMQNHSYFCINLTAPDALTGLDGHRVIDYGVLNGHTHITSHQLDCLNSSKSLSQPRIVKQNENGIPRLGPCMTHTLGQQHEQGTQTPPCQLQLLYQLTSLTLYQKQA